MNIMFWRINLTIPFSWLYLLLYFFDTSFSSYHLLWILLKTEGFQVTINSDNHCSSLFCLCLILPRFLVNNCKWLSSLQLHSSTKALFNCHHLKERTSTHHRLHLFAVILDNYFVLVFLPINNLTWSCNSSDSYPSLSSNAREENK